METSTLVEIVAAIVLVIAVILFLVRRNAVDAKNTNPELSDALEDEKKEIKKINRQSKLMIH